MNGIILIDKPINWTSRDVVNKISHIFNTKKVGHSGTLDPLATGVLVICVGKYTKLVNLLTAEDKEYIAKMKLGILTDTMDITGNILEKVDKKISTRKIRKVFQAFPSIYEQTVPKYSAIKVNGKKLYDYARENIEVNLPTRTVSIKKLELLAIEDDNIIFRSLVSKGTYIRSLIVDLAKNMDTVATMTELRRIKQGKFNITDCYKLEDINGSTPLLKIEDIFTYQKIEITDEIYKKVKNGNPIKLDCLESLVLIMYNNEAIAIYEKQETNYRIIFSVV